MPQFANAYFWHSPVFANTQFHTSLDLYQCLIIAGTHFLPILDSIWIPNVVNTVFLGERFWFSRINKVIYVDQYQGTIKMEGKIIGRAIAREHWNTSVLINNELFFAPFEEWKLPSYQPSPGDKR